MTERTPPAQVVSDDHHDHWWCFAACTRAQTLTRTCSCANWLLHPAPTSAQKGLDPLQLALHGGVFLVINYMARINNFVLMVVHGVIYIYIIISDMIRVHRCVRCDEKRSLSSRNTAVTLLKG